jgi:predicted transcriptional regulator
MEMKSTAEASQLPSPAQCRAARSALSLTVLQAAHVTGVSHASIVKIEAGGEVRASVMDRLRAAFEAQGVTFAPDGRGVSW